MKTPVSLTFLKKLAKKLKKEKSLRQHQALDEASKQLGHSNYRNYLNISKANRKQPESDKEVLLKNIYSENDMSKKLELAISFIQNYETSFQNLLGIVKLFQHSEENLQFFCEKLNLKNKIQSYLLKDFLTDEGKAEIHFRQPYFIAKEISLSDLTYEIDDDMLCVDGNYYLKTEFEFEIDENDPISKDNRFNDRKLFGSFEITIDKNQKIIIVHSDIGEEFDGVFQTASFR